MQNNLEDLNKILHSSSLPDYETIYPLAEEYSDFLENEKTEYRPLSQNGEPGSLLDFQSEKLPVVVVPDIHARPYFLWNILNYRLEEPDCTVFEALSEKKVIVVCVGDALHSERHSRTRWIFAEKEIEAGTIQGPAMTEEMTEGLAVVCALMKLKLMFPQNFHFLKGNHENIMNRTANGDYSFRKYADEGHMVMQFIKNYYGEDVLYLLHCSENSMPLIAVGTNCVISHAEPKLGYTKNQLINARMEPSVVAGLTWTDNGDAKEDSAAIIIKELASDGCGKDFVYLGGHRPVQGNYRLLQNGTYIQIHNPSLQNIAVIKTDRKFNPDEDIKKVGEENE